MRRFFATFGPSRADLIPGPGRQRVSMRARRPAGGPGATSTPIVGIDLVEDENAESVISTLVAPTEVTSSSWTVLSGTFDASDLPDPTGAEGATLRVTESSGGPPALHIGSIELLYASVPISYEPVEAGARISGQTALAADAILARLGEISILGGGQIVVTPGEGRPGIVEPEISIRLAHPFGRSGVMIRPTILTAGFALERDEEGNIARVEPFSAPVRHSSIGGARV